MLLYYLHFKATDPKV